MKIVLDTNVLLAGLFTRGVCELLTDLCFPPTSPIDVFCSEPILAEFAEKAATKFHAPRKRVGEAIDYLRKHVQLVRPAKVPKNACRDRDDLPILGTALAAQAHCLVTGDRDLLSLKQFRGITILSPRHFLDRIQRQG